MNFRQWLFSNTDSTFNQLRDFARDHGWSDGLTAPEDLLRDLRQRAPAQDVAALEPLLMRAWVEYRNGADPQAAPGTRQRERSRKWRSIAGIAVIGLISLILLKGLLYSVFIGSSFLSLLAQADVARGLITFFFAIGTIGVAIAVAFAVLTGDVEDIKGRFPLAKDVLTVLIGVLGTIIGYYFGTAQDEQVENLAMSAPLVVPSELTAGSTFQVLSSVQGGRGPYTYSLTFDSEAVEGISQGVVESGLMINHSFTLPESFAGEALPFEFTVRDLDGRERSIARMLPVLQTTPVEPTSRTALVD